MRSLIINIAFCLFVITGYAQQQYATVKQATNAGSNTYTASVTGWTFGGSTYFGSTRLQFVGANTGSATLNINGSGALGLRKLSSGSLVNLSSGDIVNNYFYDVTWNGTVFVVDLASGGSVTNVSGTSPINVANGTTTPTISIDNAAADGTTKGAASFTANDFNASSGNISLDYANGQKATSSVPGFLSNTDWSTFNNKESVLTFNTPLSRSTNTVSIPAANGSTNGYLSSTDWTTFNGKYGPGGTDVAIADGGTGQSTAQAGFNALSPLTTSGDVLYHNGTNNARLATGTGFLKAGTPPTWSSVNIASADVSGVLPVANGGLGTALTLTGNALKNIRVNSSATGFELSSPATSILFYASPSQTFTGTTETRYSGTILIPAGTILAGDELTIRAVIGKNNATDSYNFRVYYNTTDNLSGATQIALANPGASQQYMRFQRTLAVTSLTSQVAFNTALSGATDFGTATNAPSTPAINFNNNVYLIITVQMGGATSTNTLYTIKVIRE